MPLTLCEIHSHSGAQKSSQVQGSIERVTDLQVLNVCSDRFTLSDARSVRAHYSACHTARPDYGCGVAKVGDGFDVSQL